MRLVYWPDERLMQRCKEVKEITPELLGLIDEMREVAADS